jgi:hypothetical protein
VGGGTGTAGAAGAASTGAGAAASVATREPVEYVPSASTAAPSSFQSPSIGTMRSSGPSAGPSAAEPASAATHPSTRESAFTSTGSSFYDTDPAQRRRQTHQASSSDPDPPRRSAVDLSALPEGAARLVAAADPVAATREDKLRVAADVVQAGVELCGVALDDPMRASFDDDDDDDDDDDAASSASSSSRCLSTLGVAAAYMSWVRDDAVPSADGDATRIRSLTRELFVNLEGACGKNAITETERAMTRRCLAALPSLDDAVSDNASALERLHAARPSLDADAREFADELTRSMSHLARVAEPSPGRRGLASPEGEAVTRALRAATAVRGHFTASLAREDQKVRLLPIRTRSRGERRSLRTFPVVTLHPRFPFNRFNV